MRFHILKYDILLELKPEYVIILICTFKIKYGDVLDLTGRLVKPSCESERCSPLSTSKNTNGNNVMKVSFAPATTSVAQAA